VPAFRIKRDVVLTLLDGLVPARCGRVPALLCGVLRTSTRHAGQGGGARAWRFERWLEEAANCSPDVASRGGEKLVRTRGCASAHVDGAAGRADVRGSSVTGGLREGGTSSPTRTTFAVDPGSPGAIVGLRAGDADLQGRIRTRR